MITHEQYSTARRMTGSMNDDLNILVELCALTDACKRAAMRDVGLIADSPQKWKSNELAKIAVKYRVDPATLYCLHLI